MDGDKAPSPPAHILIKKRFAPIFVPEKKEKYKILKDIGRFLKLYFIP